MGNFFLLARVTDFVKKLEKLGPPPTHTHTRTHTHTHTYTHTHTHTHTRTHTHTIRVRSWEAIPEPLVYFHTVIYYCLLSLFTFLFFYPYQQHSKSRMSYSSILTNNTAKSACGVRRWYLCHCTKLWTARRQQTTCSALNPPSRCRISHFFNPQLLKFLYTKP